VKYKVLLLEAGGPLPAAVEVPAFGSFIQLPELNYVYKTVPQVRIANRVSCVGCGIEELLGNITWFRLLSS